MIINRTHWLVFRKTLLFFLTVILICLVTEMGLRIAGHIYLSKSYIEAYRAQYGNSKGENINIVCLGESSTEGLWVKWEDSYPKQLENQLRQFYSNNNIKVIVPPHIGQNTSQVANRINRYISLYRPKLIILMVGCNNTWSFAESHIIKFMTEFNKENWKVRVLLVLDNFRLFKVLRYAYLKFAAKCKSISNRDYLLFAFGHPEYVLPETAIWPYFFEDLNDSQKQKVNRLYREGFFEKLNRRAFAELWKFDVRYIIQEAKLHNVKIVLMTYHINPMRYISINDYMAMAEEQGILLIRNDISFDSLIKRGVINNFILSDNWHPNKLGYSIIANNIFEEVKNNDLLQLQ